jgi:hypothetical protein
MKKSLKLLIAIATISLTGCATTIQDQHQTIEKLEATRVSVKHPLYGLLTKTPSGYRFTEFTDKAPDGQEPWVHLSTLSPSWEAPHHEQCYSHTCRPSEIPEKLFYEDQVDTDTSYWAATALTMGLGLAFMPHSSIFNAEKYNSAVTEAAKFFKTANGVDPSQSAKLFDEQYTAFLNEQNEIQNDLTPISVINFDQKIVDNSGYFSASEDSKKFNISRNFTASEVTPAKVPYLVQHGEHLDTSEFLKTLNLANQKYRMAHRAWIMSLKNSPKTSFSYVVDAPEHLLKAKPLFKYTVTVNAITSVSPVPTHFVVSDKNITIRKSGRTYEVDNKTNAYILLKGIDVYVNGDIIKFKPSSSNSELSLPPQSVTQIDKHWQLALGLRDYSQVTKDKAEKINLNFGIAARYLINNLSTEQTLALNKKMTLDALISARLNAGVSITGH